MRTRRFRSLLNSPLCGASRNSALYSAAIFSTPNFRAWVGPFAPSSRRSKASDVIRSIVLAMASAERGSK